MLSDADTAMYFCKNNGRNRTQIQEYETEEGRLMA
jgi:PleD family two-component response regulator